MINKLHLAMIELYRGGSKRILSGSTWEWDPSKGCSIWGTYLFWWSGYTYRASFGGCSGGHSALSGWR